MRKNYILCLLLVAISFTAAAPAAAENLVIHTSKQTISLNVEIADTDDERIQGLQNRETLAPHSGMLFIFETPNTPQFWMKDTKMPLDMVFIAADGTVEGIHENAVPYSLTPIPAPAPILAVLEISGGTAKTLGIAKGSTVNYKVFQKDEK